MRFNLLNLSNGACGYETQALAKGYIKKSNKEAEI